MKRTLLLVVLVLAAFAAGYALRGGSSGGSGDSAGGAVAAPTMWTCSMHPQIQLPDPGACPVCGMDLIPAGEGGDDDGPAASLTLSPAARARAEAATWASKMGVPVRPSPGSPVSGCLPRRRRVGSSPDSGPMYSSDRPSSRSRRRASSLLSRTLDAMA